MSPAVPRLAEYAKQGDWRSYRALCLSRLGVVAVVCIAGLAVIALPGLPLLRLLAGRSGLTIENVYLLWSVLLFMSGYLLGGALNYVLSQAIYSTGDTVTPPKIGVISFTVGIPLKLVGFYVWDIRGIAAASGAQQLFGSVLYALAWRRTLSRVVRLRETPESVP